MSYLYLDNYKLENYKDFLNSQKNQIIANNTALREMFVHLSWDDNIYENINDKYDLIVTNPPIRAGKEVVYNILQNAKEHLNKDGELWFVIRKDQGVKSAIKHISENYIRKKIKKSKGFYIVKAKKR